jgi:hypothetical protein
MPLRFRTISCFLSFTSLWCFRSPYVQFTSAQYDAEATIPDRNRGLYRRLQTFIGHFALEENTVLMLES